MKYCMDCKYFGSDAATCQKIRTPVGYCIGAEVARSKLPELRNSQDWCGPEGRLFEQRYPVTPLY